MWNSTKVNYLKWGKILAQTPVFTGAGFERQNILTKTGLTFLDRIR